MNGRIAKKVRKEARKIAESATGKYIKDLQTENETLKQENKELKGEKDGNDNKIS
jgi:predicted RNase H-like HicB family nuclease